MTGLPAERLTLRDRGLVAEGLAADLALFDPDTVIDRSTFEDPHQYPVGIPYVFVNGDGSRGRRGSTQERGLAGSLRRGA